ncbi:MAG: restriction endonuclease [Nanoarchaeota archaeon]|nr:restriction endonuclease [Nanoarchaeota archaeon]
MIWQEISLPNIKVLGRREHQKASEVYLDVLFVYPENKTEWKGAVPIEYRRTGVHAKSKEEVEKVLKAAYNAMKLEKKEAWIKDQDDFWSKSNKEVTRKFFEKLRSSEWKCVSCQLPQNPNWARRIQDIKELGYTLATNTGMYCNRCKKVNTHLILLRIPRGGATGYETLSPNLRNRIVKVLGKHDAYEDAKRTSLLPDHKFPEIRWDKDTKEKNPDHMSDDDIMNKFQLLGNQRNQQKREVCRRCFQTGKRGTPFGINFFYEGNENWPSNVPKTGKVAEKGCAGCGWYDMIKWRSSLNKFIAFPKK